MTGRKRSTTVSRKQLAREMRRERAEGVVDLELVRIRAELDAARPRVRADCERIPRPCPFLLCRYHLAFDLSSAGGLKENFPGKEFYELEETCALDVADRGGITLEEVGRVMAITRERVRQIETKVLVKLEVGLEEKSHA